MPCRQHPEHKIFDMNKNRNNTNVSFQRLSQMSCRSISPLHLVVALFLILCYLPCRASDPLPASNPDSVVNAAREYCDNTAIDNIEGIWELTEERVWVLIQRITPFETSDYTLTVVDSFDGFTRCGETIGTLSRTADPNKFKLELCTTREKKTGKPTAPKECLATLSDKGWAFVLTPRKNKFKLSFNPMTLLPRFWRILRVSPREENYTLPHGMVKVYPSYDGNGSSRFAPRYL